MTENGTGQAVESRKGSPYPWLWDVQMTNEVFDAILRGGVTAGQYDREWAALRLIEYAPYRDIRRLLADQAVLDLWPSLAGKIRSRSRREGMEFLVQWLKQKAA